MKQSSIASDGMIERARRFWAPRIGSELNGEDARQIIANATGFFSVLAEWSSAERAAANDNEMEARPDHCETSHES